MFLVPVASCPAESRKFHVCLERSILSPIVRRLVAWFAHDNVSVDAVAKRGIISWTGLDRHGCVDL
ncbi:hypothetical protein RE6C_05748 [Rhodopirellula europaea 6C]|uniref:Uncharacterized protein n=1 Tax=Rhodopirellula europaea 6C TaxID=1263867 RepID=M2AAJ1_9BACT|nr:hypothetical protein RE6C_05748 [Rhodopirellula europaea 6C]